MTSSTTSTRPPDRIHFGSCNSHHYQQVLWPRVKSRQAAAFVWAGDAIYGDDLEKKKKKSPWLPIQPLQVREATPSILQNLYREQLQNPGYRALMTPNAEETVVPPIIMGTFDDHDYGRNNGDQTYRYRRESAMAYVDFIEKSNRGDALPWRIMKERAAAGKGLYGVKVLDFQRPIGQELLSDEEAGLEPSLPTSELPLSDRSVAIFLLDCRSNKTPWVRTNVETMKEETGINYQGDFLGEEQWVWFEQAIGRSTAAVNIIVQGLQVHPERYFDGHIVENWSRFPLAQHRLYQAVLQPKVQAPILVSGDVHMSEMMRKDCRRVSRHGDEIKSDPSSRLLLEVTTSGMTHSWGTEIFSRPARESALLRSSLFQKSLRAGMHLAHFTGAWNEVVTLNHTQAREGAKVGVQYTLARNFGEFEFDWEKRQVALRILGEDATKPPLLSSIWGFDALSGDIAASETGLIDSKDYGARFENLASHGIAHDGDWICVSYRGHPSDILQLYGVVFPLSFAALLMLIPIILPALLACFMMRSKRRNKSPSNGHKE